MPAPLVALMLICLPAVLLADTRSGSDPLSNSEQIVSSADALLTAIQNPTVKQIVIGENLGDLPTIRLLPGTSLRGDGKQITLRFAADVDGIQLTSDNQLLNLRIETSPAKRAIFNDSTVSDLAQIELKEITTIGRVQILARDKVKAGHIEVNGLDIISADATAEIERPHEYGVDVLQGAFTLWNMQPDPTVVISANLLGLSAGQYGKPVLGSGIFVSGASDNGGRLAAQHLETRGVYSDGKIAPGTHDQISGGVFTVYGATLELVNNRGPVITYGVNDMALDNWGTVDRWFAEEKITTLGPSGIGFVNFGTIGHLRLNAPIETFGLGARGFNVYTGTVDLAEFDRIVTHGDGAIGVQIAQPIGRLIVRRGIETFGGTGQSLVKGVLQTLSAIALSIKPGGSVQTIEIDGGVQTKAKGVAPIELDGSVGTLKIAGGLISGVGNH